MGDEKLRPSNGTIEVVLRDLEGLLRRKLGNSLVVDSFTTANLVSSGENYGSMMLKVDAEVRRDGPNSELEEISLVAKMVPPTEFQMTIFNSPVTFRTEIYMFTDIVPAFKALERECGIPETEVFDLLPEFYGSRLSLNETEDKFDYDAVILMENLKVKNYACGDRMVGVDLAHARLVIEALARFHALGIALKVKQPQLFEKIKIYFKSSQNHEKLDMKSVQFISRNVKKVPDLLPHLARIEKALLRANSADVLYGVPDEPWGTIVHTDVWVNNIMFRDDASGIPKEVKFVDFQSYSYENPLRDLIFFLFTSCNADVRTTGIEDLIDLYYQKFMSHVKMLKCGVDLFSRDSFNEQLVDAANIEYMHCVFIARFIIMNRETDPASKAAGTELFDIEPPAEYYEYITETTLRFIKENIGYRLY